MRLGAQLELASGGLGFPCVWASPLAVWAASYCGGAVPKANVVREALLRASTYHLSVLLSHHTDMPWAKLRPWHIPELLWKGDFPH